jgi:hypothetical protein
MCLRCGVVEYPYRSWPLGPTGPGDYGSPPDNSPPEYDAAPTGGFFGIGARGRDYRMATGLVGPGPRGRREHPHEAAHHPLATRRSPTAFPARAPARVAPGCPGRPPGHPWSTIGEASSDGEAEGGRSEDDAAVQHGF